MMVLDDRACLECGEECEPDVDVEVLGPDKIRVGWVHEECAGDLDGARTLEPKAPPP